MKKIALFIPFSCLLSSCASITPVEGTWNLGEFEIVEDTCNFTTEQGAESSSTSL